MIKENENRPSDAEAAPEEFGGSEVQNTPVPLIKENRLWLGATGNNSDMVFAVPKGTPLKESDREKAERLGYPSDDQYDYTRMGNSCWFTNIEHGRRHEFLQMMTMEDNLRYSRRRDVRELGYRRYDNFDAIEVPFVEAIPSDFDGMMGVPVTFLDRYNPEQFEILFNADDMTQTEEFGVDPLGAQRVADYLLPIALFDDGGVALFDDVIGGLGRHGDVFVVAGDAVRRACAAGSSS